MARVGFLSIEAITSMYDSGFRGLYLVARKRLLYRYFGASAGTRILGALGAQALWGYVRRVLLPTVLLVYVRLLRSRWAVCTGGDEKGGLKLGFQDFGVWFRF